jgi:hypothetical protein
MKLFGRFVPTAAAGLLVLLTAPLAATHIPENQVRQGDTFTTRVVFTPQQPAAFTGGVRIAPGTYDVHIVSMGDGSVRASFFDKTGRKKGEANGIIGILRPAGESKAVPGVDTRGTVTPGPPNRQATFSSLGFQANSSATFRTEGSQLKLAIGNQGQNQILIGLLLPAIQPSAVQKAREAAAAPMK